MSTRPPELPGAGDRPGDRAFDGLADAYARARPNYPAEAIAFVLAAAGLDARARATILDVGCGTGISTRGLARHAPDARVVGLDPNREMIDEARRSDRPGAPAIEWRVGRAESPPLPDASVALVTCFQSFHWFDRTAALAAFDRVLRPDGALALVWNERDPDDALARAYDRVVDALPGAHAIRGSALRRDPAAAIRASSRWTVDGSASFRHAQRFGPGGLRARAISASYVPRRGPERERALSALDELEDRLGDGTGCAMGLLARVTIARRRA